MKLIAARNKQTKNKIIFFIKIAIRKILININNDNTINQKKKIKL